ncbi:FxLYD domain-containing protein [Leucobacter tenebrionis]|nr:FxLYD domain-containing protein [Leucobacter tenebrionis]
MKQPRAFALTGLILAALALITSCFTTAGLGAAVESVAKESAASQGAEQSGAEPSESATTAPEPEEEAPPAPRERLTLDEGWSAAADEYGFSAVVTGYVSNNSDKAITNYVQITFDTYDAAGANLGTCLANTNTIDANGKWKFEAHCFDAIDEIAEVRFKEITGF